MKLNSALTLSLGAENATLSVLSVTDTIISIGLNQSTCSVAIAAIHIHDNVTCSISTNDENTTVKLVPVDIELKIKPLYFAIYMNEEMTKLDVVFDNTFLSETSTVVAMGCRHGTIYILPKAKDLGILTAIEYLTPLVIAACRGGNKNLTEYIELANRMLPKK